MSKIRRRGCDLSPAFFLLAFASLWPYAVRALDYDPPLRHYLHTAWTQYEGNALPAIRAIAQTTDGYLWLATDSGLLRFDGVRFVPLDSPESDRLPSRAIRRLLPSKSGGLWVGTDAGICRIDRGRVVRYPDADVRLKGLTLAISEDSSGVLWTLVMVQSQPVLAAIERNSAVRIFGAADGLPANRLTAMYRDRSSRLWLGTSAGLCQWSPGSPAACSGGPRELIVQIGEDPSGTLLAFGGGRILRDRNGVLETLPVPPGAAFQPAELHPDDRGNLWIPTVDQGLLRWREGRFERFTHADGLSGDLTAAVLEDREGNLWVATASGIDRFRPPRFQRLTTGEGLSGNTILSVAATRDGAAWAGTMQAGLNRISAGSIQHYGRQSGLPGSSIQSLYSDPSGLLWIGVPNGLSYLSGSKFEPVRGPGAVDLKGVFTIAGDSRQTVWLADAGARLYAVRNGVASAAEIPGSENILYRLQTTRDGALWAGFLRGGVTRLQDGKSVEYGPADGLAGGAVQALYEDDRGALWVGTTQGLSRYRDGRWTTWTARHGVPENIYEIIDDGLSGFWLMTGKGLFRLNRADLDAPPQAGRQFAALRLDRNEGLKISSKPGMCGRYMARSPDGRLWISTEDGLAVVDPARLRGNPVPPPVIVEQILIDDDPADLQAPGGVVFRGREVQIAYTALSFGSPEGIRFRYRLENLDREWTEAGTRRNVAYVNLSPARYRFHVIACNSDGVWNEAGAAIDFRIAPYFYQTVWFYGSCLLVAGFVAWGSHRLHIRRIVLRLQWIAQERSRVTRELHDSLLQGFSGVVYQLEASSRLFDTDPVKSRLRLDKAIEQADRALHEARRTLMDLRIPDLEVKTLPEAIQAAGAKLTADSPVDFHLTVRGALHQLGYDVQAALYLIAREAANNAVNHAQPRRIQVTLTYAEKEVVLAVQDDGAGFDPQSAPRKKDHWGLAGMEERARLLRGTFQLETAPHRGTRITVRLPR
jgi:ligand-binding sensor domain-containing protein/signal transduction histidine kinase